MDHREERDFVITIHLAAVFDEAYDGDDDGFAWHARFEREVRPKVVAAVFDALRADASYQVVPSPRGRTPSDAIDIDVQIRPRGPAAT